MPNIAQVVHPPGLSIAPESLAPLPSAPGTYVLSFTSDGGTPPTMVCVWILAESGGDPVTGSGWGFRWGHRWGREP